MITSSFTSAQDGLNLAGYHVAAHDHRGHGSSIATSPGARHEVFNELNRDEITADLISWLRKH